MFPLTAAHVQREIFTGEERILLLLHCIGCDRRDIFCLSHNRLDVKSVKSHLYPTGLFTSFEKGVLLGERVFLCAD